jgi:GNAT superfamily N-acetyltransferase
MNTRPFHATNKDYAALLAIHALLQPEDQLTVEMLRKQDEEFSANHAFVRILGEVDNQIVTYGAYWRSSIAADEPHQFSWFAHPEYHYEDELFRPESWAIAVDAAQAGAQQYVGMSVVNLMPTRPDTLFAGITGVVPSHRRRKIATMLKVCSARHAQQHGYRYITTDNEENNPMYRLNLQLGFEPLPAWVYYEKRVR